MKSALAFIRLHPLLSFYALAFAISWGGILVVVGPAGIPCAASEFDRLLPSVGMALLAGPAIAGLLSTGFVDGREGLRSLLSHLRSWRVHARWYAVALLIGPLAMTLIPLALSSRFPAFLPRIVIAEGKLPILLFGTAAGIVTGIFEELGWTGFAVPRLMARYGYFTTGLIAGALWAAWHLVVNFWSSGTSSGALSLTLLLHSLIFSIGVLPAFRVLMVWVYDRTGSLPVAMLMHMSLTTGNVILVPQGTGTHLAIWSLVLAATLWGVVAAVAGRLERKREQ